MPAEATSPVQTNVVNAQPVAEKQAIQAAPRAPLAFIPTNLTEAWRVAELLAKANILPDALRGRPHDILVTIMTGTELGLSPMAAIREIYVVKGKGYLSSLLKVALVKQSPECEYFRCVESTAARAIFETKRKNEGITRFEYTIQDAVRAELVGLDAQGNLVGSKSKKPDAGKDNWEKNPKLMLRRRCAGELADEVYPEITRGCGTQDDLPGDAPLAVNINAAPTTFAPPPPAPIEDAQVAPPSPPTPKQAFEQAKNDLELKGVPPAEPPKKRATYEDKSTDAPPREPGSDEGEEHVPREPESDLSLYAQVQAIDPADPEAEKKLDVIAPEAKKVQGPGRQQLGDLIKAKRAAVAAKKAGK